MAMKPAYLSVSITLTWWRLPRLEGQGPVGLGALAASLGLEPDEIGAVLMALEVEGFAMRGRFTQTPFWQSPEAQSEFCVQLPPAHAPQPSPQLRPVSPSSIVLSKQ